MFPQRDSGGLRKKQDAWSQDPAQHMNLLQTKKWRNHACEVTSLLLTHPPNQVGVSIFMRPSSNGRRHICTTPFCFQSWALNGGSPVKDQPCQCLFDQGAEIRPKALNQDLSHHLREEAQGEANLGTSSPGTPLASQLPARALPRQHEIQNRKHVKLSVNSAALAARALLSFFNQTRKRYMHLCSFQLLSQTGHGRNTVGLTEAFPVIAVANPHELPTTNTNLRARKDWHSV